MATIGSLVHIRGRRFPVVPTSVLLSAFVLASCERHEVDPQLAAKIDAQAKQIAEMQAALKALPASLPKGARFQVMNGTPQFARNIMLVDTESGRVWVVCETKGQQTSTSTNWCAMDFFGTSTAAKNIP